jgi:hypothetical protein
MGCSSLLIDFICCLSLGRDRRYGNKRYCRASAAKTHGKERTAANCTVNALCRALFIVTHGKALPCVNFGAWQRISKSIKKLLCVEIDARQTLQKK